MDPNAIAKLIPAQIPTGQIGAPEKTSDIQSAVQQYFNDEVVELEMDLRVVNPGSSGSHDEPPSGIEFDYDVPEIKSKPDHIELNAIGNILGVSLGEAYEMLRQSLPLTVKIDGNDSLLMNEQPLTYATAVISGNMMITSLNPMDANGKATFDCTVDMSGDAKIEL